VGNNVWEAQKLNITPLTAYALVPPVELFTLPQQGNSTQNRGVHTGSGEYILRTHRGDADAIRYEHGLLQWLAGRKLSFGVPVPIASRTGETLLDTQEGLVSLALRLPGNRVERGDPIQVQAMGFALGELHAQLVSCPMSARPDTSLMGELQHAHPLLHEPLALTPQRLNLAPTAATEYLLGWWREEIIEVERASREFYARLPRQVIHHDFIPNNVLTSGEQVTAILDFEFATYDLRVLDIAIALRNMLRPWENAAYWQTVDRFCRGYRGWISLREEEVGAIPQLVRLRNSWLTLKRLGQALGANDMRPGLQQLEHAQQFAQWLVGNEQHLMEIIKDSLL
jgi:homoserine kinase type II